MSARLDPHVVSAPAVHAHAPASRYVTIWAVLLLALGGSLVLGAHGAAPIAVAIIFGIAVLKAGLVVGQFMHLSSSPRWLKVLALSAVAVVAVLYVGLVPDVQWHWAQP